MQYPGAKAHGYTLSPLKGRGADVFFRTPLGVQECSAGFQPCALYGLRVLPQGARSRCVFPHPFRGARM